MSLDDFDREPDKPPPSGRVWSRVSIGGSSTHRMTKDAHERFMRATNPYWGMTDAEREATFREQTLPTLAAALKVRAVPAETIAAILGKVGVETQPDGVMVLTAPLAFHTLMQRNVVRYDRGVPPV